MNILSYLSRDRTMGSWCVSEFETKGCVWQSRLSRVKICPLICLWRLYNTTPHRSLIAQTHFTSFNQHSFPFRSPNFTLSAYIPTNTLPPQKDKPRFILAFVCELDLKAESWKPSLKWPKNRSWPIFTFCALSLRGSRAHFAKVKQHGAAGRCLAEIFPPLWTCLVISRHKTSILQLSQIDINY